MSRPAVTAFKRPHPWNGTITFGLIAVPVKVHSATEDKSVHFHQVDAKDGARIKQKRICSKENKEVPYKQVAQGYEVRASEYVLLSKDEIAAAAGEFRDAGEGVPRDRARARRRAAADDDVVRR
jgi:non-homologous end joining protein Ku